MGPGRPEAQPLSIWRRRKWQGLAFIVLLACIFIPAYTASNTREHRPIPRVAAGGGDVVGNVWLVDKTKDYETYSNGLRIDDRYAVSNERRGFYRVFRRGSIDLARAEWRSEPAGIVYHTTESDQARFEEEQNKALKRIAKEVLTFVRENRCYHFLIDRFGQVFRVVEESDVANHAGYSVWADDSDVYVNLNRSFIGIAFETQTLPGEELPSANAAQIHSARILTQMLRNKYRIPASNCVTHAQVSVNPSNMLVGYHTDWAGNFPFLELGLSDNYVAPPAAIYTFGFNYDTSYVHATGVRLWQGLAVAEDQLRAQATAQGIPLPRYRSILQQKYKQVITALKASNAVKEKSNET